MRTPFSSSSSSGAGGGAGGGSSSSRSRSSNKLGIVKRGPWTAEEDEVLSNYVKKEGEGGWRTLPMRAGLERCGKSCRLRWVNYLRPNVKRGQIDPDEEDLILRLHRLLGNRWSLIAGRIPGRTDNEIKNYWNTHLSKKLIRQGIDPRNHKPLLLFNPNPPPVTAISAAAPPNHHFGPPNNNYIASYNNAAQDDDDMAATYHHNPPPPQFNQQQACPATLDHIVGEDDNHQVNQYSRTLVNQQQIDHPAAASILIQHQQQQQQQQQQQPGDYDIDLDRFMVMNNNNNNNNNNVMMNHQMTDNNQPSSSCSYNYMQDTFSLFLDALINDSSSAYTTSFLHPPLSAAAAAPLNYAQPPAAPPQLHPIFHPK